MHKTGNAQGRHVIRCEPPMDLLWTHNECAALDRRPSVNAVRLPMRVNVRYNVWHGRVKPRPCAEVVGKEHNVCKVIAIMSMSLDGYVADLNHSVADVLGWYFTSGNVEIPLGGPDSMTFQVSAPSAAHFRALTSELGALLTGRRTFDAADGWGGNHHWGPAFVLTHHIPAGWPRPNSTVHFVTDGIQSAVHQAKTAAAGKSVGVHGADTIQQCLNAGLLDEIHVDIVAVLLGSGVRLFDHLAGTPVVLGNPAVTAGSGVTHLRYPVRNA